MNVYIYNIYKYTSLTPPIPPHLHTALLAQRWDLIFFTGSESVGKIVHQVQN